MLPTYLRPNGQLGRVTLFGAVLLVGGLLLATGAGPGVRRIPPAAPESVVDASTICQQTAHLDRLVVHRSDAFPQNHLRFSFPAEVIVTNGASVRDVAHALCSLAEVPNVAMHCPVDLGVTYQLDFASRSRGFPMVSLDATGCQTVTGLGPTRWVARSPSFWHTLGSAMGLAKPTYETFRGGTASTAPGRRRVVFPPWTHP